jgi:hypothetical protein
MKGWVLKRGDTVRTWKRRYMVLEEKFRVLRYFERDDMRQLKGILKLFNQN